MIEIKELTIENIEIIKKFFFDVFTKEPWNDDWSNEEQLHQYIIDLAGNRNSLTYGLFDDGEMLGLSIGSIRHWYAGTEYHIDEFCIKTSEQGKGLGSFFMKGIEEKITEIGLAKIFLQTDRNLPAYRFYTKNGFIELSSHASLIKDIK